MKRTVELLSGETRRVALPEPHWSGRVESSAGVFITGLFAGPRTGRRFLETYSQWDDGTGRGYGIGERYSELDETDYLKLCARVGTEPIDASCELVEA
jgi:hypothetical protein